MSKDELSDNYVAELLKKDASSSSARYASVGLQAYLPARRPTGQAPKPNTRFLRHILRDTDNHNAALLAKEAEESRARLRALREGGTQETREQSLKSRESGRRRGDGDSRPSKRRRAEDSDTESDRGHSRRREHDRSARQSNRSRHAYSPDRDSDRAKGRRSRHSYDSEGDREHCRPRHSHRSRGHRDRSATDEDTRDSHRSGRRHRHKHRSRSESKDKRHKSRREARSRSVSEEERRLKHRRLRSPSLERSRDRSRERRYKTDRPGRTEPAAERRPRSAKSPASDSDPLEAIVGPMPPRAASKVQVRGRGATRASSAMDAHFSADYDPTQDVQPASDEDDWDMALEALRDRQRWKQQGAERLKAAGFTDDEVKKWEKGGERTEEDVRWRKKGEDREWDRGKVVDDDGHIDIRAEWGRLKGT